MSRIGRKPIVIPAGVTVTVDEAAHHVAVKGPKGSLNSNYHPLMTVKVEGNEVLVTRPNDEPQARSLHGLTRTKLLFLQCPAQAIVTDCGRDRIATVSIHHADVVCTDGSCRLENVPEKRTSGKCVQHFGQVGPHTRALTRCENDDAERQVPFP